MYLSCKLVFGVYLTIKILFIHKCNFDFENKKSENGLFMQKILFISVLWVFLH